MAVEDHRLPAGLEPGTYGREPFVGLPVILRFAGEEYQLPARAPAAWWRAVAARRGLLATRDAAFVYELHDALLEVLRLWRPDLTVLPERHGRLYRGLAHAYGEVCDG